MVGFIFLGAPDLTYEDTRAWQRFDGGVRARQLRADGGFVLPEAATSVLLDAARGPGTARAETPDPLRYEQLPDPGQSADVGRDQVVEP